MGLGGLTAAVASGAEYGRRRFSLLTAPSAWVEPQAAARAEPLRTLLIVQRGPNPSTDYYLKPRAPAGVGLRLVDLADAPRQALAGVVSDGLWAIVCRYLTAPWLAALRELRPARLAFFADDDLPALQADRTASANARGKIAAYYGRFVRPLSALATDVWLSTPTLAALHPSRAAAVLPPVPEADPPSPAHAERRVVYHGTDGHGDERRFALRVAARLAQCAPDIRVEITGDGHLERQARALGNVDVVRQAPWPDYLTTQRDRRAAVFLAPLARSRVNDGRAPVKAFDAARLGAAALFGDHPVFRSWVRPGVDGLLVEQTPDAFAEAAVGLLNDETRRLALASAARARLIALRAEPGPLPGLAR